MYFFVSIPSTANIAASMGVYHIGKLRIVVVGDFLNIGVQAQTRLKFGSFPSLSLIQTQARRHQSTNRRSRSSWASNGGTNTWCAVIFHTPALPNKGFPWLIYCLHFGRPDQVGFWTAPRFDGSSCSGIRLGACRNVGETGRCSGVCSASCTSPCASFP